MARPNKYETHVAYRFDEIEEWLKLGATEKEVFTNLGIGKDAWIKYKRGHKELNDLIKKARKKPVEEIKAAMLKKAIGFSYEETRVTTQHIELDDGSGVKTPARVIRTEVSTKYALPSEAAGLILLQHWDLNDDGSTKWSRDPSQREIKKEELELKKKQVEESTW